MEKKNLILLGVLGTLILIFCAGLAMDTSVNTTEEGLNKTQLTTADVGTTYSITIDCSGVSNLIKISGMDFIPQGGIQEFYLEEGAYSLYGAQVAIFALFEVTSSGVVSYDSLLEGSVLLGEGTSILTVIGHPITINATTVDQGIALGYWAHTGFFLGWTEPGDTTTYNLVVSGQYNYGLWAHYIHRFTFFDVLPSGVISYDESQVGIIEGNNTNTVKAIGHSITIDATDVDQGLGLGYWAYPEFFLGWTEPGNTRTYKLVVSGTYNYGLGPMLLTDLLSLTFCLQEL